MFANRNVGFNAGFGGQVSGSHRLWRQQHPSCACDSAQGVQAGSLCEVAHLHPPYRRFWH